MPLSKIAMKACLFFGSGDCGIAVFCAIVGGDAAGLALCDLARDLWHGVHCQLGDFSLNHLGAEYGVSVDVILFGGAPKLSTPAIS